MKRNFYILPANKCEEAIAIRHAADKAALDAKVALLSSYSADGLLHAGHKGLALAYKIEIDVKGMRLPLINKEAGKWMLYPDTRTKTGKAIKAELDYVAGLVEVRQWSLEKALGIYGCVFDRKAFHYVVATPLEDGCVVVSWPIGANVGLPNSAISIAEQQYMESVK